MEHASIGVCMESNVSIVESISVDATIIQNNNSSKKYIFNHNKCQRQILKPKNIFKSKCNKAKRKLKKYKLRKDGKEDQDVLDVSQTLLTTLKIKSPNKKTLLNSFCDFEESTPKNYLFKMARRKPKVKSETPTNNSKSPKETQMAVALFENNSQSKQQTNAFKLMMDSRNKSIGSNSPGKEKIVESSDDVSDIVEKKSVKVKRNLALQKMAEAKGFLKNKEIEDYKDECIKRKMEKRAEQLKKMITKRNTKGGSVDKNKRVLDNKNVALDKNDTKNVNKNDVKKQTKILELVDLFNDDSTNHNDLSPKNKVLTNDDEQFLKKLSPSIKKKENMLCYFKKIDKVLDCEPEFPDSSDDAIIKVKMTPKNKKKCNTKKLSLNKDTKNDILKDHNENGSSNAESHENASIEAACASTCNERRKRKRKENIIDVESEETERKSVVPTETRDKRPKRNVKKPVKYSDDVYISSSDEELHIFTPKKRKQTENRSKCSITKDKSFLEISHVLNEELKIAPNNTKKNTNKEVKTQGKPTKLAPIFTAKPQLTSNEIEAKHKFLHSGIPEQLKKIIVLQKKENKEFINTFPAVVHIQQITAYTGNIFNSPLPILINENYYEEEFVKNEEYQFKKLLVLTKSKNAVANNLSVINKKKLHEILKGMKELYPKFPVYRTYHTLNSKSKGEYKDLSYSNLENSMEVINNLAEPTQENPENLAWIDKYKAVSTNQILGNFSTIRELRKWLVSWTENEMKQKDNIKKGSDSSDFYDSDMDSGDSSKSMNNLLILSGPVGSGKTSTVYAVASELAFKVIEVNASSKRTGKMMLQDLQEATQSHKVNRRTTSVENSQKSQSQEIKDVSISKNIKKKGRPKKPNQVPSKKKVEKNEMSQSSNRQDSSRMGMSLILIDDADIVFDQDDGFSSGIAQLIQSSKRPVILVTTSLTCPHLQRFLHCGKIMRMNLLSPTVLGTWLDIMCLAENRMCWPGLGGKYLDYFKGDIRKTINCLQFYMTTTKIINLEEAASQDDYCHTNVDDESSSTSWADRDGIEESSLTIKSMTNFEDAIWKSFIAERSNLLIFNNPLELFNIWWSVPSLFKDIYDNKTQSSITSEISGGKKKTGKDLEAVADVLDCLSFSDYVSLDSRMNISAQPWCTFENDGVSELENYDSYYKSNEVSNEILHTFLTRTIINTQNSLNIENKTEVEFPSMAVERERYKIITRHENLSNFLNLSAVLDRKALALDYWTTCRTICRIEKAKIDTISKRNNRYYHYLKSLNVLCKNDAFDKIADSLHCNSRSSEIDT